MRGWLDESAPGLHLRKHRFSDIALYGTKDNFKHNFHNQTELFETPGKSLRNPSELC